MAKKFNPKHPGDELRRARLQKGYSKQVVMRKLGISKDILDAIERWELANLPGNAHLLPLLRRHVKVVGLDYDELSASYPNAIKQRANPQSIAGPKLALEDKTIVLSSLVKIGLAVMAVLVILGYVLWQGSSLGTRPRLSIEEPGNNSQTTEIVQVVRGQASQNSQIFVNGTAVLIDQDGQFSASVVLQNGTNTITVRAVNNVGSEAVEVLTVVRQ